MSARRGNDIEQIDVPNLAFFIYLKLGTIRILQNLKYIYEI